MTHNVTLKFLDGDVVRFEASEIESIMKAADRAGIRLARDCEVGDCQTCLCSKTSGETEIDEFAYVTLEDNEIDAGALLTCVSHALSDVQIELPYTRASLIQPKKYSMTVTSIELLHDKVFRLTGRLLGGSKLKFHAGQYVNISLPDGDTRSFSMSSAPAHDDSLEFFIARVPSGKMSAYLATIKPGDQLKIKGPYGLFYLRASQEPVTMIAGGTGIAPMLSMLREMRETGQTGRNLTICYGANTPEELVASCELAEVAKGFRDIEIRKASVASAADWDGHVGYVTDLLDEKNRETGGHFYLCGPPPMIESAKSWVEREVRAPTNVFAEEFKPS